MRQVCWSHLLRDFAAHSEGLTAAQKEFGAAGLRVAGELFAAWDECHGDADRARLAERIAPLQEELRALLDEAAGRSTKTRYHRTFARNLLKLWPALWTFASVPSVEPRVGAKRACFSAYLSASSMSASSALSESRRSSVIALR